MPAAAPRPAGTGRVSRREPLRPRGFRVSLQVKILIVVLLFVAVPLIVMSWYFLNQTQAVLENSARGEVTNNLDGKVNALDSWIAERMGEVPRWANAEIVFTSFELLDRGGPSAAQGRADLSAYLNWLHKDEAYGSLFFLDAQGRTVAGTRPEDLEPWARERLPRSASARPGEPPVSPATALTPLAYSERLGAPTMLVLYEIQKPTSGSSLGYLAARLDLRRMADMLVPVETGAKDARVTYSFWLLDDAGNVLIGPEGVAQGVKVRPFPELVTKGTQVAEGLLPDIGDAVYRARPLQAPLTGALAVTVPRAEAYHVLAISRSDLLRAALPAVVTIFLLGVFLARSMLRPILLLSEGAQRVSAGDLDVHLPVRGRDEIAELTSAFNEMARRVRESRDELAETATALARTNDQLEQAKERFRAQAITDALTGLFNRRHFEDTLDQQIERAMADAWPLSLLLLDLDHFKQYNDRWGHTEGDAELRRVAAIVQRTVRSTDIAFRYGGEELAVLLPSCAKDQAAGVAEKVRQAVAAGTQRPSRFGARTTVSVGVATFPEDGRVARGLVDAADAALYQAKALGRDRVVSAGMPSGGDPADRRAAG